MKIWKLAEYSDNRDYDLQKIWRKNKQDYFFDDTPGEIRALHERFDNSWVYREVTSIPVSQPCVYFLFLPKDSYKIGETTVGNLNEMDLDFFLSKLQPHEEFVLSRSYGIPREMTNIEIAEAIGCHRNEVTGIRNRALRKCQRIATHLKSGDFLTKGENWAAIMADPVEAPQMELLFN